MVEAWICVRPVNTGEGREGVRDVWVAEACLCVLCLFFFKSKTRVPVVPVGVDIQTIICSGPLVVNIIQCFFFKASQSGKKPCILNVALAAVFINQPSCIVSRDSLSCSLWSELNQPSQSLKPWNQLLPVFDFFPRLFWTVFFGASLKTLAHTLCFCWVSNTQYDRLCVKY